MKRWIILLGLIVAAAIYWVVTADPASPADKRDEAYRNVTHNDQ